MRTLFTKLALVATCALAFGAPTPAAAEVTAIDPDGFGVDVQVETFEGIAYVLLPPSGWPGFSSLTEFPWTLPGGVVIESGGEFNVYDAIQDPDHFGGWGLGYDGDAIHDVNYLTELPSPTSFAAHDNFEDPSVPLVFGFAEPVLAVGTWIESNQSLGGDHTLTLEAFAPDGTSLGAVSIPGTDGVAYDNALDGWIGLASDQPIGSVALFGMGFVFDDLTWSVTGSVAVAPATWGGVKSLFR